MVAGGRELIDTLWNVNDILLPFFHSADSELIDTLWNVNIAKIADKVSGILN